MDNRGSAHRLSVSTAETKSVPRFFTGTQILISANIESVFLFGQRRSCSINYVMQDENAAPHLPIVTLALEVARNYGDDGGIDWEADGPPYIGPEYDKRYGPRKRLLKEVVDRYGVDIHLEERTGSVGYGAGLPELPAFIHDVLLIVASSGFTTAVWQALKAWLDSRNGRKLKIRVGDIEVEATQMKEADVLRIFELLEEKAERKKIREALLNAGAHGV